MAGCWTPVMSLIEMAVLAVKTLCRKQILHVLYRVFMPWIEFKINRKPSSS
jgi:hypothetical protein